MLTWVIKQERVEMPDEKRHLSIIFLHRNICLLKTLRMLMSSNCKYKNYFLDNCKAPHKKTLKAVKIIFFRTLKIWKGFFSKIVMKIVLSSFSPCQNSLDKQPQSYWQLWKPATTSLVTTGRGCECAESSPQRIAAIGLVWHLLKCSICFIGTDSLPCSNSCIFILFVKDICTCFNSNACISNKSRAKKLLTEKS